MKLLALLLLVCVYAHCCIAQRTVCDMSDLERDGYKGKIRFVVTIKSAQYKHDDGNWYLGDDFENDPYSIDSVEYSQAGMRIRSNKRIDVQMFSPSFSSEVYTHDGQYGHTTTYYGHNKPYSTTNFLSCPAANIMISSSEYPPSELKAAIIYTYQNNLLASVADSVLVPDHIPTSTTRYTYQNDTTYIEKYVEKRLWYTEKEVVLKRNDMGNPTAKRTQHIKDNVATNKSFCAYQYIYYP